MANKIGIIGAGAAGLFAAGRAASLGNQVKVFEKNKRAGKKLLITGKGRCNITNNCTLEELMDNIPETDVFSILLLINLTIMTLWIFESINVPVKTERGNRVFPVSDRSQDIVNGLINYVRSQDAQFYEAPVKEIVCEENKVKGYCFKTMIIMSLIQLFWLR